MVIQTIDNKNFKISKVDSKLSTGHELKDGENIKLTGEEGIADYNESLTITLFST